MAVQKGKQYELKEVVLRLAEGQTLYSEQAISNADAAVEVMRKELMQQDREKLCVIKVINPHFKWGFNFCSSAAFYCSAHGGVRNTLYLDAASDGIMTILFHPQSCHFPLARGCSCVLSPH